MSRLSAGGQRRVAPAPQHVPKRVSIQDVARASRVSAGTVSNVLNHPERVVEAKRARVEAVVQQLGFVRNESARHLRAGSSRTLGLLLLDAWNPFFTEMARGVEDWAFSRGWTILISNSARQAEREAVYLRLFAERRIEGLIVVPNGDLTAQLLDLRHKGIPSVMVDTRGSGTESMSVSLDDVHGGQLAVAHLLGLGHRRLAFVGNSGRVTQVRDRLLGSRQAIAAAQGTLLLTILEPDGMTVGAGRIMGERILDLPPVERPTALFASNDLIAIGILQTLLRAGVQVPGDVAMVGYDDIEFARHLVVPLTSIRQPAYEMGRTAAEMLMKDLAGVKLAQRHVVFAPTLVVRESTTGPGAGA